MPFKVTGADAAGDVIKRLPKEFPIVVVRRPNYDAVLDTFLEGLSPGDLQRTIPVRVCCNE